MPTLGYILSGSVEVQSMEGKSQVFAEGDTVVEVMGTLHRGIARDGAVEILVFYAGASGLPNTVLSEEDPGAVHCDFP